MASTLSHCSLSCVLLPRRYHVFSRHLSQSGGVLQAPSEWTWRGAFKAAAAAADTLRLVLKNFKPDVAYEFKVRQSSLLRIGACVAWHVLVLRCQRSIFWATPLYRRPAMQCSTGRYGRWLATRTTLSSTCLSPYLFDSPPSPLGRVAGPPTHNRIRHRPPGSLPPSYRVPPFLP